MTLGEYLRQHLRPCWAWGTRDCCTFVADWCVLSGRPDPMAFIRGSYSNGPGAHRAIIAGGGLLALWQRGMADAGVPVADSPELGDVGLLEVPTEEGINKACGIYTGERWATLGVKGLGFDRHDVLALWRP